jgi:hypothetical protein
VAAEAPRRKSTAGFEAGVGWTKKNGKSHFDLLGIRAPDLVSEIVLSASRERNLFVEYG